MLLLLSVEDNSILSSISIPLSIYSSKNHHIRIYVKLCIYPWNQKYCKTLAGWIIQIYFYVSKYFFSFVQSYFKLLFCEKCSNQLGLLCQLRLMVGLSDFIAFVSMPLRITSLTTSVVQAAGVSEIHPKTDMQP